MKIFEKPTSLNKLGQYATFMPSQVPTHIRLRVGTQIRVISAARLHAHAGHYPIDSKGWKSSPKVKRVIQVLGRQN